MTLRRAKTRPSLVMVVDDHQDTRELYATFLRWSGMVPLAVPSGEAALARLEDFKPDIVVCDFRLPGMTGVQLLGQLRASDATALIPVVFLTGDSHVERKPPGAALLLHKPVTPEELVANIRRVLAGRR